MNKNTTILLGAIAVLAISVGAYISMNKPLVTKQGFITQGKDDKYWECMDKVNGERETCEQDTTITDRRCVREQKNGWKDCRKLKGKGIMNTPGIENQ